ncbi:hypothetical protein AB0L57_29985 [Nocardia sp. NPDC052254]|uniref:hypothetical protein n=1 Tax=Nocardia sp. NPDC052254 TaxID=3155681 RepID=UPI00341CA27E
MSISESICRYCNHRNGDSESRCAHCGAPLPAVGHGVGHALLSDAEELAGRAGRLVTGSAHAAEKVEAEIGKAGEGVRKVAGEAEKGFAALTLPVLGWKGVFVVIAGLLVLVVVVIRSCSIDMPSPIGELAPVGQLTPVESLPDQIRTVSSCSRAGTGDVDNCVIAAEQPLLAGAITGGRALTFTVREDPPADLTAVVSGWRAAGGTVVADGAVFIGVGPSATVRYADTRTGLRIETAAFANRAGAQTFLYRSGLVR